MGGRGGNNRGGLLGTAQKVGDDYYTFFGTNPISALFVGSLAIGYCFGHFAGPLSNMINSVISLINKTLAFLGMRSKLNNKNKNDDKNKMSVENEAYLFH